MRKKRNFFIWIVVLLCFFVLLNIFTSISDTIRGRSLLLISPIQSFFLEKGNNFFKFSEALKDAEKISSEIEKLKKENIDLNSKLSSMLSLKEENKALRDILEINLIEKENLIFSQVIGRDILNHEIIIRHDKDVDVGLPVITPEGILIGIVEKKYANGFASIRLITSSNTALEVKIQNEDFPIGVLKGSGEKELQIDLLPKNKSLYFGDFVVAVPDNKGIKKEFYVGRIFEIEETDIEVFKRAKVWQGIDYRYLTHLFVVY